MSTALEFLPQGAKWLMITKFLAYPPGAYLTLKFKNSAKIQRAVSEGNGSKLATQEGGLCGFDHLQKLPLQFLAIPYSLQVSNKCLIVQSVSDMECEIGHHVTPNFRSFYKIRCIGLPYRLLNPLIMQLGEKHLRPVLTLS